MIMLIILVYTYIIHDMYCLLYFLEIKSLDPGQHPVQITPGMTAFVQFLLPIAESLAHVFANFIRLLPSNMF